MNMRWSPTALACSLLTLLALAALPAQAQEPSASEQTKAPTAAPQGPLTLERIKNGVVVAPDYKVTDIDGWTGQLVGGYAGWLADNRLLIGGAGYWLANGNDEHGMAYGGVLVGWQAWADRPIAFGARGLVGLGEATISTEFPYGYTDPHNSRNQNTGHRPGFPPSNTVMRTVIFDQGFFVFEPQASVIVRLASRVSIDVGVGYRVIGAADGWEDRIRGVTGSVAIRFGLGGS